MTKKIIKTTIILSLLLLILPIVYQAGILLQLLLGELSEERSTVRDFFRIIPTYGPGSYLLAVAFTLAVLYLLYRQLRTILLLNQTNGRALSQFNAVIKKHKSLFLALIGTLIAYYFFISYGLHHQYEVSVVIDWTLVLILFFIIPIIIVPIIVYFILKSFIV